MRIYAMYDRKLWIIWLFVILASVDVAVGCVSGSHALTFGK